MGLSYSTQVTNNLQKLLICHDVNKKQLSAINTSANTSLSVLQMQLEHHLFLQTFFTLSVLSFSHVLLFPSAISLCRMLVFQLLACSKQLLSLVLVWTAD